MKPVLFRDRKAEAQPCLNLTAPACATCRDMGFTLPPEWNPTAASGVLAATCRAHSSEAAEGSRGDPSFTLYQPSAVFYRYGRPCACAAGQQFQREQAEWNQPITQYREPVASSNRASRFQGEREVPAKWEPPPWSDPPAPKTAVRDRAPLPSAADILQIQAQQEANRKERQP